MDMITVLNTIPAQGPEIFGGVAFGLFALVLVVFAVLVAKEDSTVSGIFVFFGALLGLGSFACFAKDEPVKYECTINDGVDFKAFTDTFKVDEQRGEIYVVRLKEKEP